MEKALQDYFYVSINGTMKLHSRDDSLSLIEGANNHILKLKNRPAVQMAFDCFLNECMDDYFRNGVTDNLLNKLNKNMETISHQYLIEKSRKKLVAVHIAHIPFNPQPRILAAYLFSQVTSLGGLEGLKRCKSPECNKFYIGRSNVKWCSKTCGSRSRVKKMRKKNNY